MQAQEAINCSPQKCAIFVGKGYCLIISQRGPTIYIDLTLDEANQLATSWLRAFIPDLECINEMAQCNHPDFSANCWQPVQDLYEIHQYNLPRRKRRSA